nr:unnamed protein product [Callosobruchus analis]
MCDMTATSIMYIGLNLTNASSFQMFRGSVIVFVGLLSVAFLGRVMIKRQWTGDLLIIIAQIIQAIQMVVEEKFVAGQNIPSLQAVGWEGTFGFLVLAFLQIPFYYIRAGPPSPHIMEIDWKMLLMLLYKLLIGFVLLLIGMCTYNGITCKSIFLKVKALVNRRYGHIEDDTIENRNAEDTVNA